MGATCTNSVGGFSCACNNGFSGDGVSCTMTCGDGVRTGMEICDDGNRNNGDGCSSSCSVETGYVCVQALRVFTAGTCGNNGQHMIASKADCEAAARQLA